MSSQDTSAAPGTAPPPLPVTSGPATATTAAVDPDEAATRWEGQIIRERMGIITQDELAAALGLTPQTLEVWRMRGMGPAFVKLGRGVFYRMSDLADWMKNNTRVSTQGLVPDSPDEGELAQAEMAQAA